jgi:hypothetical protein
MGLTPEQLRLARLVYMDTSTVSTTTVISTASLREASFRYLIYDSWISHLSETISNPRHL